MAPKSRSGIIRQVIGPLRSRLANNIASAAELLTWTPGDDINECQDKNDYLNELANKIKSNISTINDKDKQWQQIILGLDDDAELTAEEAVYANFALDSNDGFFTVVENGKEMLCCIERKVKEIQRHIDRPGQMGLSGTASNQSRRPTVKLPKLSLPQFGGDICEWVQFWAIFKTNVHDSDLSPSEKFAYLLGQLSGSALKSIQGIPLSDANYNSAIAILKERFERSDVQQIGTLYSQLKKLKISSNKVSDMVSTFDSCEKIFRQLEAVGERTDSNRSLVLDVLSKYSSDVVRDLMERFTVGPHSTVAEVREALRKYIKQSESLAEVLDDLTPFNSASPGATVRSKGQPGGTIIEAGGAKPPIQTSAFTASSSRRVVEGAAPVPQNPCYFCGGGHFNSECTEYKTSQERVDRLQKINRCSKCLSSTHDSDKCGVPDNRKRCFFCKSVGQHVSPVCPVKFNGDGKPSGGFDKKQSIRA